MPGIRKLKEKAKQQKEIEEILAKEIKEYHTNWEQYLVIKPLPALSKKQNKIKTLGNKLKTEFKQVQLTLVIRTLVIRTSYETLAIRTWATKTDFQNTK